MRDDAFVRDVLDRCEALKAARIWASEPKLRPRAWLNNFEEGDRWVAAELLDHFTFYNEPMTDRLLEAAYHSLADGLPKGPQAPDRATLASAVRSAAFTPIQGEDPNLTDSGNLMLRKARQLLQVPEDSCVGPEEALRLGKSGHPVVFLDDFVGSGDQFLKTWRREYQVDQERCSFETIYAARPFTTICICLVAASKGSARINTELPHVALSVAHVLDETSSVMQVQPSPTRKVLGLPGMVDSFLRKYQSRLRPSEPHIAEPMEHRCYGYKGLGLMFAFSHSVPDSSLPIFWSPGTDGWVPLVVRQ